MTSIAYDRHVSSQPEEVARLLQLSVPELDPTRPLVLSGIGTSLHACRMAASWVRIMSGGRIRPAAIDAHDLAMHEGVTAEDQLIVVSHRGTKRYPQAAIANALEVGANVVAISGQGAPAQDDAVAMLESCAQEAASTHTVSYTSALAILARLCCTLLGEDARGFGESLEAVPGAMATTLELPIDGRVVDALAGRSPAPILVAGSSLDAITAEEAALKIKEGTYRWSEGLHSEFALHGTPAVYDEHLSAILIRRDDDGGRAADLAGILAAVGASVFDCSDRAGSDLWFMETPALLRPFVTILPLQRLVSELAAGAGASPDQTHLESEPWSSAILSVKL